MDDRWESEIIEYGAINITGFRIIDTNRKFVRDFLDGWKKEGAGGKESISVIISIFFLFSNIYFGIWSI